MHRSASALRRRARFQAFAEDPSAPLLETRFEPYGNAAAFGLFGGGLIAVALLSWLALPWHLARLSHALEGRLSG